ncbi:MAG: DNA polymerase IV [Verrucomicrobiota bacterium]
MPRVLFHLDMDAFFASVEQRDRPELRGQPVIVGGNPDKRGVVAAASYEARKFGVRSAMPGATARRLCPEGIFVPPRREAYQADSARIRELMRATGARVEPVSIDEAYLELTDLYGRGDRDADEALLAALPVARELKNRIHRQVGLTCSIGIASNKMLAKIASDFNKPDGLCLIPERDKVAFLRPLPAGAIHGVGKVTAETLRRAGIATVGDLQDYRGELRGLVGSWSEKLQRYARGEDDRELDLGDSVKSISSEETFDQDTQDRGVLRATLRAAAEEIAAKLERRRLAAKTVQVKVRYGDFTTLTRQQSVAAPVSGAAEIYRLGCHLLAREHLVHRPLRLLGLGVANLTEPSSQLALPGSD